jgi:hypothetical protein
LTAEFVPDGAGRDKARRVEQPAGQGGSGGNSARLSRQKSEHRLNHFLRQFGLSRLPERRVIHHRQVTRHQDGKGFFAAAFTVLAQQPHVRPVVHLTSIIPKPPDSGQKSCEWTRTPNSDLQTQK